ncbi:MAG: chloride channel protein [Deltaproteobacteria bacterium]|nr:chloride channel protein [Deltaproteobacteria bacterium]
MVVVAIFTGVAGGFGAIAFRELIKLVQSRFFGGSGDLLPIASALPWTYRLLIPALGGLIVGPLVYFFAREAKGHGVPEVMEAVTLRGGTIRPRVVAVKALASAISIGSGGSVGREGPIVQIGSALSSTIGQFLRLPSRHLRTIVACGAASGIAATFNAPIAGALFAVEIILGDFGVAQFSPIVISSVVATVLSRHFLGDFPAFDVPDYALVSPFELVPYMGLGIVAAFVGVGMTVLLYGTEDLFERVPMPEYLKPALGGLLIGCIGVWLPEVFGVGYGSINHALVGSLPLLTLGALLLAKMVATSVTIGSGGSGGVFAPSLFLGAVTGGFFGTLVHQWFPGWTATSGAYALVGMSAVVAATTHAPITAIIIIFEMTGDYTIVPPLMASCVVSSLLATWLKRDSIYTMKLMRRGVDIRAVPDANVLKHIRVADIFDREAELIPDSAKLLVVLEMVVRSRHKELFVLNNRGELEGAISLSRLREVIFERETLQDVVVAGDLLDPFRMTVTEQDDLDHVLRLFGQGDMDEIAVVPADNPRKVIGVVRKSDVIEARNRALIELDLTGSLGSSVRLAEKLRRVDLGDGHVMGEILAPPAFLGRTIGELNVRVEYGVQVIFIRNQTGSKGGSRTRVPSSSDRIREGDTLLLAGPTAAVERIASM